MGYPVARAWKCSAHLLLSPEAEPPSGEVGFPVSLNYRIIATILQLMQKLISSSFHLLSLLIFLCAFCAEKKPAAILPKQPLAAALKPPALQTIVLDAGHGGIDPGTTNGLFSKEKDVTLAIVLKLGPAIQQEWPRIKVVYTRTTDILPGNALTKNEGLVNRALIANKAKGDLFISIHCDATVKPAGGYYMERVTGYTKKTEYTGKGKKKKKKTSTIPIYERYWVKNTMRGATTYIWRADRNINKSEAINELPEDSSGLDIQDSAIVGMDPPSPEALMRAQLYEQKYFQRSLLLGTYVEDAFAASGRTTWGVKQRDVGIRVLEATGMPSILIETGYLSNKEEEEYLNSEAGQNEIVQDIVSALRKYKQILENNLTK